jgi:hypothetical protein
VLLGIHLTLLIGPAVPVPAPVALTEALVSAEVTHTDEGHSGFQLTFQAGRSGPMDIVDYPLLLNPLLRTFNRVILMVTFNAVPRVLFDGFITRQQLQPSNEPGGSTLTVSGEDVSVMMDLVELKMPHPAQDETTIVFATLAKYAPLFLMPPMVIPPNQIEFPPPTERIPTQQSTTDRKHVTELGSRFNHVFYVTPGPLPGQNTPYWGPARRPDLGLPQPALSVNVGPASNVESVSFQYDALAPTVVADIVQVSDFNIPMPVIMPISTRVPPLALMQSPAANLPNVRISSLASGAPPEGSSEPGGRGGLNLMQAYALAASQVNAAADKVVTVTGELDALRYGQVLMPRGLVGLRGAGFTYDGHYYVKSVTHTISKGDYKQKFILTREGVGALTPIVRP